MKLQQITVENMRGKTLALDLSSLNILLAANGRGKSTTLEALQLALSGRIYRLGLKTEALLPLFREGTLAVGITGMNGSTEPVRVSRSFRRKGKTGALEQSLDVMPAGGARKLADLEAEVRRHFGACTVALDLNELLSLTSGEQKKLLFGFADPSALGLDRASLMARVRAKVITEDVEVNAQQLATAETWLKELPGWWGATSDVEDGLSRLSKAVDDALKTWKKNQTDAEGSQREMADQTAQQTPARELAAVEEELTCARSEATQLEREDAADAERRRTVIARGKQIGEAQKSIGELQKPGKDEDYGTAAANTERRRLEFQQIAPVTEADLEAARVAAEAARSALKTATDTIDRIDRDIGKIERRAQDVQKHECPTCACDVDQVRANVLRERAPLQEESATVAKGLDRLQREGAEASGKVEALRRRANKRTELETANTTDQKTVDDALAAKKNRLEKLEAAQKALLALQEEDAKAAPVADNAAAAARLQSAQARVQRLEAEHKIAQAARERRGIQLAGATRRAQAKANVAMLGAIKTAVGPAGVQGEVVAVLAGPLTTAANVLLDLVGEFRLGVRMHDERGNADFILGWECPDGEFITWENLSGGQRAIFGAALATAMLELQKPPLRLLTVDGLEALDNRNKLRLMGAIGALHAAGKIDTAIVAGVTMGPLMPAGPAWTVHKLNGAQHEVEGEAAK